MPEGGGPGASDAFDPNDLADVLARVVMPVVNSIIKADELDRVDMGWGPRISHDDDDELLEVAFGNEPWYEPVDDSQHLYVLVAAKGTEMEWPIWKPEFAEPGETLDSVAFAFADVLEDFVFDSIAPWGELRISKYTIPERKMPAS